MLRSVACSVIIIIIIDVIIVTLCFCFGSIYLIVLLFFFFLCQTPTIPLTPLTLCTTIHQSYQGHRPSQRSLMSPRAVSRCHGNPGLRQAPLCLSMS